MDETFSREPLAASSGPDGLPVNLDIHRRDRLSRWLLLVKWLLAIPALLFLVLYGIAVAITTFISFWAILITGRYPHSLFGFARTYMELQARTYAYFPLLLTDQYPLVTRSEEEWEVRYDLQEPAQLSRLMLLAKLAAFLLNLVGTLTGITALALLLAATPAWFAILLIGRYPRVLFDFAVAVAQWTARVTAWEFLLRDEWLLFATTRPVAVVVGLGAAAAAGWGAVWFVTAPDPPMQNFQVEGSAMEPTLCDGDFVLVNTIRYRFGSPKRGHVIVFRDPNTIEGQPERLFIKRVVGEPGDTVEVRDGSVFVNGETLVEPYLTERPSYTYDPTVVPPDYFFVLGDNRNNSSDSHLWGPVPEEDIIGRASLRYWPLSHFGTVGADAKSGSCDEGS